MVIQGEGAYSTHGGAGEESVSHTGQCITHRGVYHTQDSVSYTGRWITRRGVYHTQGGVSHTGQCVTHRTVYREGASSTGGGLACYGTGGGHAYIHTFKHTNPDPNPNPNPNHEPGPDPDLRGGTWWYVVGAYIHVHTVLVDVWGCIHT